MLKKVSKIVDVQPNYPAFRGLLDLRKAGRFLVRISHRRLAGGLARRVENQRQNAAGQPAG
jgi:hypothetical protein